jgi:protein TonB
MKLRITFLFLSISSTLYAQELIQNDYEKGYVKDGKKYSLWQYFNANKEVELSINHTTGRVMYVIPDTSAYVIFKNGEWITSKLDVHPIPITGSHNFYLAILDTLKYPAKDYGNGLEGKVVTSFEIDTLGNSSNYQIIKSIGGGCDSVVLASFKAIDRKWVPARIGRKKYSAKFAMGFEFRLKKYQLPLEHEDFQLDPKKARLLEEFIIAVPVNTNDKRVFTFVEHSAEPVGGLEVFFKWVEKNLRYPAHARRMGLEGKVFVKFIIEPTGAITNPEVVKGFNKECEQEALRLFSIAPNWNPGTQSGRAIRQAYTLPISFKLNE